MVSIIAEVVYYDRVIDKDIENSTIFDIDIENVFVKFQCIQKTLSNEGSVAIVKVCFSPNISAIKENSHFKLSLGNTLLSNGRIIKVIK